MSVAFQGQAFAKRTFSFFGGGLFFFFFMKRGGGGSNDETLRLFNNLMATSSVWKADFKKLVVFVVHGKICGKC